MLGPQLDDHEKARHILCIIANRSDLETAQMARGFMSRIKPGTTEDKARA